MDQTEIRRRRENHWLCHWYVTLKTASFLLNAHLWTCITEKRDAGKELWQKCNATPVPQQIFNVSGLIEGRQYEFRVFAVNGAGISPPSSNTSPVLVQAPKGMLTNRKISGSSIL